MSKDSEEDRERRWTMAANAAMDAAKPIGAELARMADAEQAELRARLARVEALADEWSQAIEPDGGISIAPVRYMATELRAALA